MKGKVVKAYLSFPGCSKLPTIHYRGDLAVVPDYISLVRLKQSLENIQICFTCGMVGRVSPAANAVSELANINSAF